MRAVEGVQLVHHQKAQHAAGVVPPEWEIDGPRQQQIEHLVVGEQDVRRVLAQDLTVLDEVVRPHSPTGRRTGLAHVQPCRHPAPKRRCAVDNRSNAPRLIRRESVHGIDDDGLDAGRAGLRAAVVEHRIEEALGLAGTGSGRDDGGLATVQPIEGGALMAIRREAERGFRERLAAFRCALKRQVDGEVRPLEQVVGVSEKVRHHIGQCRIRRAEAGREEVPQGAGDFGGEGGGDHGCSRRSSRSESGCRISPPALPRALSVRSLPRHLPWGSDHRRHGPGTPCPASRRRAPREIPCPRRAPVHA